MTAEEELLYKRFLELARKSQDAPYFIFTDFLGLGERSVFTLAAAKFGKITYKLFGGSEYAERVMVRFGDEEELGWDEPFPIKIIKVEPSAPKYAEKLTHRDYLGSILALGIERCKIGDIAITETEAYIFAEDGMAEYIKDSLCSVRRTAVRCSMVSTLPEGELYKTKRITVQALGERLDGVIAKVFSLSREEASRLFAKGLVFIDGALTESCSKIPKPGQVVSVRGKGRFIYLGYETLTKKGKKNIEVELYI